MSEARVVRLNERVKLLAGFVYNLAAVLMTALVVRLFTQGLDFITAAWIAGEAALAYLGWLLLGLMEDET